MTKVAATLLLTSLVFTVLGLAAAVLELDRAFKPLLSLATVCLVSALALGVARIWGVGA